MGFFYSGGGERVALQQTKYLRERGHTVNLYSPIIYWNNCFPDELREVGPERIVPHFPFPFPFREASAMIASAVLPFKLGKLANCDVLLCHSQPSMWIGYRVAQIYGTPYVGYLHQPTTFIHKRPKFAGNWRGKSSFVVLDTLLGRVGKGVAKALDRICHQRASALLFNSNWTKQQFEETYNLTGEVCYPAITSPSHISGERKDWLLTANRHYPWKRIDLAFEVLKHVQGFDLFVTGEPTQHTPFLVEAAKQREVAGCVHFTGFITNVELQQLYSQSMGYIQTSVQEPFGMSSIEAQSFGVPAVVWGDAGVKETVLDGETGFHATPYDLGDFERKTLSVVDKGTWGYMSREAKIWGSTFTWDTHVDLLEHTLEEVKA